MARLTEYHGGVAVIKDRSKLKEAMAKLAEYEDAEEERRLYHMPCKVGDTVFAILTKCNSENFVEECMAIGNCEYCKLTEEYCIEETECSRDMMVQMLNIDTQSHFIFGETVFLTREEAEAKLQGK